MTVRASASNASMPGLQKGVAHANGQPEKSPSRSDNPQARAALVLWVRTNRVDGTDRGTKVPRTMRTSSICSAGAFLWVLVLPISPLAPGPLDAQPPSEAVRGAGPADTAGLGQFARVHVAIQRLRDREHTELADPRRKKPADHQEIRVRFAKERAEALRTGGITDSAFVAWTRRISADDSLRVRFEALLTRLNAPK